MDYDITVRLCVIGDFGTGKTALLRKLINPHLNLNEMPLSATLGVDFVSTIIEFDGKKVKLCIWDTAGQEAFRSISKTFYRNVAGFIYVFSLNDQHSLNQLDNWDLDIRSSCNNPYFKKIIIGTKSDLRQTINDVDCYNKALNLGGEFIKINANQSVEHIFTTIVSNILDDFDKRGSSIYFSNDYGVKPKNYMEIEGVVDVNDEQSDSTCCVIS